MLLLVFHQAFIPSGYSQTKKAPKVAITRNTLLWKSIDSLANLGQPKSALDIVERIYKQARTENNAPQFLKAILYRIRLNSDFQDDFLNQSIRDLRSDIAVSQEPATSVLHSITAEVYWKYYQNNSYRFRSRTSLASSRSDSISTWDLKTITEAITNEYLLSLANETQLKQIPISSLDAVLESEPAGRTNSRPGSAIPTLYDFLAFRALDYFTSDALPGNQQAIQSSFASRIYQSLTAFHLGDKNPAALIAVELDRLGYFRDKAPENDSLYLPALQKLETDYLTSPVSTDISFVIAGYLNSNGEKYSPLLSNKHKWDLKIATEVCDRAVKRFPDSEGAKNCKILAKNIKTPLLALTTEFAVPVQKPSLALLSFKNVKTLYFRLIKTDPDNYSEKSGDMKREEFFKHISAQTVTETWSLNMPNDGDFQQHSAEIAIPGCEAGFYALICSADKTFSNPDQPYAIVPFWSTQIGYVHKRNVDGSISVNLLDRETGLSLKNIKAEAWVKNYSYKTRKFLSLKIGKFTSDENGLFTVPPAQADIRNNSIYFRIEDKKDLLITGTFYQYPVGEPVEYTSVQTSFYTDRAIYRPGQTIYFKGIVLRKTGEKTQIKPDHQTLVTFYDVNGQKISEQQFTSNDFGSINGSFTAPLGRLSGQMTISNESGSVVFSVEEYKRPTFEVTFNPLEGNYRLQESLTVTGKALAFAGNAINGARVKYRVVRSARFPYHGGGWYWPVPASAVTEITSGETKTSADGSFSFQFTALPDNTVAKETMPVFDYLVYTDITDPGGETQSSQQSISVGYTSLVIDMNIPGLVNLAKDSIFKISTTNLNGRNTPASVTLVLRRLQQPQRVLKFRNWEQPDLHILTPEEFKTKFPNDIYSDEDNAEKWITEGVPVEKLFNTLSDSIIVFRNFLPEMRKPGSYMATLTAADPFGQKVEKSVVFTVFDPDSREVPVNSLNWFVPLKTTGEPGEKAVFIAGSREENVNVMYEIRLHDSLVSRVWIILNNRSARVEIPIEERFRGNFTVNFIFAKFNRVFQNSHLVTVPYTNRKLDIAFETFRTKIDPGVKEEWKLRITGPGKGAAEAEFLTTMYDASLDVFRSNNWSFEILPRYNSLFPWDINDAFRTANAAWANRNNSGENYFVKSFPRLNWFGLNYFGGNYRNLYSKRNNPVMAMETKDVYMDQGGTSRDKSVIPNAEETRTLVDTPIAVENSTKMKPAASFMDGRQIRKNFQETAFFYPSLVTDSTGSVIVKFTAPESLTRWKMMGLAYTKNLEYGQVEKELVTRKELMVFPNAPRFVREGDTMVFTTRVVNLADHDLTGEARIQMFDGLTMKTADSLVIPVEKAGSHGSLTWSAGKGITTTVSWTIIIPSGTGLSVLVYRITATSGNFSDGEEKAIPVLTNRMLVTESLPLPVRGKGTFDFSFHKLLNSGFGDGKDQTLKNYRLTLEFASNPAWYAIQALPALNDKQFDNADAIFSAFYSNSIASFIANSNPKIKAVFESWKKFTPDALLSNLEKNEELKSALLNETPWVLEAKSESERKQKLGRYFDLNSLEAALQQNLKKLQRLQKASGGWTWFEGMPESRYITQNILTGLGHLGQLGVPGIHSDEATRNMIAAAVQYLDKEMLKDYEAINRIKTFNPKENHISSAQIQFLYARSYFPEVVMQDAGCRKAFEFYQQQASAFWQKNDRYLQGMAALALNRLGNKEVPQLILKSLSEKALHSGEMGMYWAGEPGYYWYQAPVESQAMMIEAFDEINQDGKSVEEMKVWLLKQKQTQDWRSPRATTEAVYALLLRGTDLLSEDPEVKISIGKEKIDSRKLTDRKTEAGTGYFQLSWQGSEIRPEMGNVKVSKSTDGVAWGSVYWQYYENLDKISPAATPMKLEKQLFVETNTPAGPVLVPLGDSSALAIGNRIKVRIVLKADRDLEFVHMKDMRASAFEPASPGTSMSSDESNGLSGYRYQDGLGYYQSTSDVATSFFFEFLPRGTYVFEYTLKANAAGEYSNGITTIQCLYAPEFSAHSEGIRVRVNQ